MGVQRSDGSDGDRRQITRRAAIGTGIAAVGIGAGLVPAASASASASAASPRRQLAALKAAIRASGSSRAVKTRLLAILGDVGDELAHGHNLDCRQILRQQFIPVVKHSRGQISGRDAKAWAADGERLARALPDRDAGLSAGAGGRVTVLNCFNEAIHGLVVSGAAVGDIDGISMGGAGKPTVGTPAGITVPRSKGATPGAFAFGDNPIVARWDSFNGTATIRIPDPRSEPISLDDPLALYVATNRATLMTLRGFVLNYFDVTLSA
jgi:hypothetical protein